MAYVIEPVGSLDLAGVTGGGVLIVAAVLYLLLRSNKPERRKDLRPTSKRPAWVTKSMHAPPDKDTGIFDIREYREWVKGKR